MTAVALMVDLSSNNSAPDLKAHHASGRRVLALKVTEGTSYTWARSHTLSAAWHALGPDTIVWHYHFLHPGSAANGAAQADYFYSHVRADLRAGDRVVCDAETSGETGSEVSTFWARYMTHDPHTPRVDYGSPYFLRDHGIRPQHGEGLWLAQYANKVSFIPPGWSSYLAWQYTQSATGVPGIPGEVDQSRLSAAALPHSSTYATYGWVRLLDKETFEQLAAREDITLSAVAALNPGVDIHHPYKYWGQWIKVRTNAVAKPKG